MPYSIEERDRLRDALVAAARVDERISGAALTGSAAFGAEDRWSDLDLAFGIGDAARLAEVLSDWTEAMYRDHGALHHLDVPFGAATYRVFLLASTLQVDLAFFPAAEFGATRPSFRLLFGSSVDRGQLTQPVAAQLIGRAWLYALHARSSVERGRLWQAEYMVSGVRDHALALAALRHGFSAVEGRGLHQLPAAVTDPFVAALVRSLEERELRRALGVALDGLLVEVEHSDPALAERLHAAFDDLRGRS